jgi:hypothetical protein
MKPKTFFAILFVSVLFSCRKEPNTEDLKLEQVVATDRDLAANFSNYATFFISDTVSIVASASTDSILTGPLALQMVNAVKTNMTARGYTFRSRPWSTGLPDLGLRLTVIKGRNPHGSLRRLVGWMVGLLSSVVLGLLLLWRILLSLVYNLYLHSRHFSALYVRYQKSGNQS